MEHNSELDIDAIISLNRLVAQVPAIQVPATQVPAIQVPLTTAHNTASVTGSLCHPRQPRGSEAECPRSKTVTKLTATISLDSWILTYVVALVSFTSRWRFCKILRKPVKSYEIMYNIAIIKNLVLNTKLTLDHSYTLLSLIRRWISFHRFPSRPISPCLAPVSPRLVPSRPLSSDLVPSRPTSPRPVPQCRQRAIEAAVAAGDLRSLRQSVSRRADLSLRDPLGCCALHQAVVWQRTRLVTYIVERCPETLQCTDYVSRTPEPYAIPT